MMASAGELLTKFIQEEVPVRQLQWNTRVARPYGRACEKAHELFKESLKAQHKSDEYWHQRKVELGLIALTIVGGGYLTAAYGTSVLGTVAAGSVVNTICNRNMERLFRAAHWIESNKTATFVLGTAWNGVGGFLGNRVKERLQQLPSRSIRKFQENPGQAESILVQFVEEAELELRRAAAEVRDNNNIPEEKKMAFLNEAKASSFCNPPDEDVQEERARKRLQLSFYMRLVLDSDSLKIVERTASAQRFAMPSTTVRSAEILRSPSSPHYPGARSASTRLHGTTHATQQTVEYETIGDIIAPQIDELYRDCGFGEPFFPRGTTTPNRNVLRRAEQALEELGRMRIDETLAQLRPASRRAPLSPAAAAY